MTAGAPAFPEASKVVFAAEVGSTNDEARRLLLAGADAWALFWAGSQSGGRGRDGRTWSSPPGNLYASLVLRPPGPPARVAQLAFVAAVAIGEAPFHGVDTPEQYEAFVRRYRATVGR
jgi:BirA family biotin operon repressor/biotin-[acetyl-CoA-carboxylase] ligase